MREVLTTGRYFRKKYGVNVYKTPISLVGFTCPNIDGKVAKGGCSFCENESFSPNLKVKTKRKFYLNPNSQTNPLLEQQLLQLKSQYSLTKTKLEKKFNAKKFLVYFQSFTNTYAPLPTLKTLYGNALKLDGVIGLSIGTRTDSINEEILKYLANLSQDYEIWIEYGIQTVCDETLRKINRGHDVENMRYWIKKTKEYGLKICGHLIFGLPNETQEMMLDSVRFINEQKIDSIKIHPMYVTKNTALSQEYKNSKFTPITEKLYVETVIKALKILDKNIIIQRVTAGINDYSLLAPSWCRCKHNQINYIKRELLKEGLIY
jgi:radical SAM protein (TIGR01212 family)